MRSVNLVAVLASFVFAAVAHAEPVFFDAFENGSGNWHAADSNDIQITADATVCSTSYEHETVLYSGGRVLTNDPIAVEGGATYCLSAFVRASTDANPYLGVAQAPLGGVMDDAHWLTGPPGYENGYGDTITPIVGDDSWHWYAASIALDPATATVGLAFQLSGSGYADFDDITLTAGPCAAAYTGIDQHQTCAADAMCRADGACVTSTPPGDMGGGGPSSSPDMGGVSVAPGSNTAVIPSTPSTPVAAEGTPSGAGAVNASGGGCSIGGHEGEESLGLMLVAFVAVMLAGRRRRA